MDADIIQEFFKAKKEIEALVVSLDSDLAWAEKMLGTDDPVSQILRERKCVAVRIKRLYEIFLMQLEVEVTLSVAMENQKKVLADSERINSEIKKLLLNHQVPLTGKIDPPTIDLVKLKEAFMRMSEIATEIDEHRQKHEFKDVLRDQKK